MEFCMVRAFVRFVRGSVALLALAVLLLSAPSPDMPALAGTATTTFNVTATVLSNCSVSATDLLFGNYSASSATPLTVNSTVSVTCTNGSAYTVALDGGTHTGNVAARSMTDGATHSLLYALYTANTYASIWGDGTASTLTVGGTGNGAAQPLTVFGRVAAAQFVTAGAYSDRITVTVSY
jgi:spore coat protein U-like protein